VNTQSLLEEKNVLIVDDDDILDTLEDLLPMCNIVTIGNKSSSRSYQSFDCAGIVAPQNLHFTGFLFWSVETLCSSLHTGHVRLRPRRLRRIADIENGFIFPSQA
jgi:hypothetical protein